MDTVHIIDLQFKKIPNSIAAFLVETSEGPILIESGPESTFEALQSGVEKIGYQIEDIQHVFLSHIHFDHAGAAWKFANHGAKIYLHPKGAPHLANPDKLWNSAKMIYGDQMEELWGEMKAIPPSQLISMTDGQTISIGSTSLTAWFTPGHAVHHIAWQLGDTVFTGDVAGVKIDGGPVTPPCPPPDIHIEDWKKSIERIKALQPTALYLTHYGKVIEIDTHFEELELILDDWAVWIKGYYEKKVEQQEVVPLFITYTQNQLKKSGLSKETLDKYEKANPSWMSVAGLYRYWKIKEKLAKTEQ
ncbi:MBL fold metallo-hydrolase [Litoribacter ruber]|uniref:MBL fold metallo-hydrolase n=1 Tax=Litoribacter ruber TaxID=702568 RepID=UPI001BD9948A|nr:MBL fold metallo-hydrolase [Litoribacter ruber]MBT0812720.1 MBL fold metallo-hydrolase [Litoribacter ruber]